MAPVLDIGCGTGETALACAARGLEVRGIDGVADRGRARPARSEGPRPRRPVRCGGRAPLWGPRQTFATVLDIGLFHDFDDADRVLVRASLFEASAAGVRVRRSPSATPSRTGAVPGGSGRRRFGRRSASGSRSSRSVAPGSRRPTRRSSSRPGGSASTGGLGWSGSLPGGPFPS